MKAVVCEAFGGPEVLALRDMPDPPPPGPGEVQVRIGARGVQYVDVLMLAGKYQFRPDPPFIPGNEGAGEIVAIGDGVTQFKIGDKVMSRHRLGAFAQLGKRTKPMPAHHPVPEVEPGDAGAARDHFAGRLAARDEGRFRAELVFAREHQDVDILRTARPDPHLYLAGARWGRVRDLAQRQYFGPAERLAHHRLHRRAPIANRRARRAQAGCSPLRSGGAS